MDENIRVALEG